MASGPPLPNSITSHRRVLRANAAVSLTTKATTTRGSPSRQAREGGPIEVLPALQVLELPEAAQLLRLPQGRWEGQDEPVLVR